MLVGFRRVADVPNLAAFSDLPYEISEENVQPWALAKIGDMISDTFSSFVSGDILGGLRRLQTDQQWSEGSPGLLLWKHLIP